MLKNLIHFVPLVLCLLCIYASAALIVAGYRMGEHAAYAKVTPYSVESHCKGDRLR